MLHTSNVIKTLYHSQHPKWGCQSPTSCGHPDLTQVKNSNVSSKCGTSKKISWITSRIRKAFANKNTGKLFLISSMVKILSQLSTISSINCVENPWQALSSIEIVWLLSSHRTSVKASFKSCLSWCVTCLPFEQLPLVPSSEGTVISNGRVGATHLPSAHLHFTEQKEQQSCGGCTGWIAGSRVWYALTRRHPLARTNSLTSFSHGPICSHDTAQ